jgi:hypothetical protein
VLLLASTLLLVLAVDRARALRLRQEGWDEDEGFFSPPAAVAPARGEEEEVGVARTAAAAAAGGAGMQEKMGRGLLQFNNIGNIINTGWGGLYNTQTTPRSELIRNRNSRNAPMEKRVALFSALE